MAQGKTQAKIQIRLTVPKARSQAKIPSQGPKPRSNSPHRQEKRNALAHHLSVVGVVHAAHGFTQEADVASDKEPRQDPKPWPKARSQAKIPSQDPNSPHSQEKRNPLAHPRSVVGVVHAAHGSTQEADVVSDEEPSQDPKP